MKKILAVILTVFMALQMIPCATLAAGGENDAGQTKPVTVETAAAEEIADGDFVYSVHDGGARIDGYRGTGAEAVIPEEIGGYYVTSIGDEAFKNHAELESVTIPESVEVIGTRAFYGCTGLATVYYNAANAADLKDDSNAFYIAGTGSASGMTAVFGESVNRIPAYLFYSVQHDTSIPEIEDGFNPGLKINAAGTEEDSCRIGLKTVRISVYVTAIGAGAFNTCEELTDVFYEGTPNQWGKIVIAGGNAKLTGADIHYGGTDPETGDFECAVGSDGISVTGYKGTDTDVVIPDEIDGLAVTAIGAGAFRGRDDLTSVTIPESVKTIGEQAFYGCTGLKTVWYNAAVVTDLTEQSLVFYGAGTGTADGMKVFFGETVTRIPAHLFDTSWSDTEVPEIEDSFEPGIGISSTRAGGTSADNGLTEVTIPTSVTAIGANAFVSCDKLTDVYYGGTREEWQKIAIAGGNSYLLNAEIHYAGTEPAASDFTYRIESGSATITGYTGSGTDVVIPDEVDGCAVTAIGANAFSGRDDLVSVTIPEGVTKIGNFAFYGCTKLETVRYNAAEAADLNSGSKAFLKAGTETENGMKVVFGQTVRKVPAYLFYSTDDTETPEIEDGFRPGLQILGAGTRTVSGKIGLAEIEFAEGVTEIRNSAFFNCTDLTEVTIPESAGKVGAYAFGDCSGLTSATFLNRFTEIQGSAFLRVSVYAEICGAECSTAARFAREQGMNFRSTGPADHVTDPDDPGTVVLEAACETDGCLEKTCTVCGAAVQTVLPAVGHRWGDPVWHWSEDRSAAAASFACLNDPAHVAEAEADVTVVTVDATPTATGLKTFTAAVAFGGRTFTDTAEEILPILDTTYTLRYDANGGDGAPVAQTVTNNTLSATFTVSSAVPVRRGYAFKGWARIDDAEQPTEGTSVTLSYPETELVLYAVWEANVPAFKSQSLVLSGQIGLNFFLELPEVEGVDYSSSYMTFRIGQDKAEYRDDFDPDHMNGAHTRYGFTCYVNSIQMADTITATFHYGDGKTVSKEYSVLKYIEFFEDNISAFNAKTIALIRAIADFGHYEQIYLAYVNDWTIGESYTEMSKYYTESFDYDAILDAVAGKAIVKTLTGSKVSKATYKLHLDSTTTVDVFLTVPQGTALTASATYKGNVYTAERQKDGRYMVRIPDIAAHQLGDMITVEGNAGGAFTVKVSALSYVRSVLANNMTAAEKDGMAALYQYYTAVLAYRK